MEVVTNWILRNQPLQQCSAIHRHISGDIYQPGKHHFIDVWRGGQHSRACDHRFKSILLRNRLSRRHRQRLMVSKITRRALLLLAGKGLPRHRDK
ncbi:Uncharacterised protein [Salmonella enterica subsp. enterica serovar Bovismorbificans]|uniref:Uncharacterized protein n=1 Tax=Salmonella enterica subsp. enterica serovar Bovismorbificans TaxID=58097 RepID=A0A655EK98_SALET|nr:Uncharacterised protein [Salmonella enterica subsp. enterica serovar Bovismorbificans]